MNNYYEHFSIRFYDNNFIGEEVLCNEINIL